MRRCRQALVLFLLVILPAVFAANCPVITTENSTYVQEQDYTGAPNNVSYEVWLYSYACVKIAASNVVYDCNGYSITGDGTPDGTQFGIMLNGSATNVTVKNCPSVSNYTDGVFIFYSNGSTFSNISSHGNLNDGFLFSEYSEYSSVTNCSAYLNLNNGFGIYHSFYNRIENSTAHSNAYKGFRIDVGSSSNLLLNDTAYNNTEDGFAILSGSVYNNITGCLAYDNIKDGFVIQDSTTSYNLIENSTAHNNAQSGMAIRGTSSNNIIGCLAYDNAQHGFLAYGLGSNSNTFANNTAFGQRNENQSGFAIITRAPNNNFINNTAHDNYFGLLLYNAGSNNRLNVTVFYNNSVDFMPERPGATALFTYSATNLTFLNPAGTYHNYTILDITDTVPLNDAYYINWSSNVHALPEMYYSFGQTFVQITHDPSFSAVTSITSVVWKWTSEEVIDGGYNSSKFELWKYNDTDGWGAGPLNDTPDPIGRTLTLYNLNPASDYGILQNNITNATNLTVILETPGNGTLLTSTNVSFNCTAYSGGTLQNITLYGDWGGWHANETAALSGNLDSHVFTKTLPEGTYTWNCLAFDATTSTFATENFTFTINTTFLNSTISLYGANITIINTSKYSSNATAGNYTTEGGNITQADLGANASTEKWAGMYGNTSGDIRLSENNTAQYMYLWIWNSSYGGVVCLSTNGALSSFGAAGATGTDIDSAWGFTPADADSGVNTYNGTGCALEFGTATVSNASYADTGNAGGFITCALKTALSPVKSEMLFCVNITYNGPIYNGKSGDFEAMVPTPEAPNTYETYYFYMSLN